MSRSVAILIVNGGRDPKGRRWIELCINKIYQHTIYPDYHIYVWNNNVSDRGGVRFLQSCRNVTLFQADGRPLRHIHATPLQILYEHALRDRSQYIVTLDSDAHPFRDGWLQHLVNGLDQRTAIAGIWRDEMSEAIPPYVHASCLCTTTDFIENHGIRLDYIAPNTSSTRHDTLSILTDVAIEEKSDIFKLKRCNCNNFHRLMGGIYGEMVYHHGAGSRRHISFWDEIPNRATVTTTGAVADASSALLLGRSYDDYMAWLHCEPCDSRVESRLKRLADFKASSLDISMYRSMYRGKVLLRRMLRAVPTRQLLHLLRRT